MRKIIVGIIAVALSLLSLIGCANKNTQDAQIEDVGYKLGSIVTLGTFNNHSLQWDVIAEEEGNILLLCRESFNEVAYDEVYTDTTWKISDIRDWCNDFYENAFTYEEKNKIIRSVLQNLDCDGDKGMTEDYVFALSYDEAIRFLPNLTQEARDNMRKTETDAFWLRTIKNKKAEDVTYTAITYRLACPYVVSGRLCSVSENSYYPTTIGHVRPAMWIKNN